MTGLKKTVARMSPDQELFLATYGQKVDYVDFNSLEPLINAMKREKP